jgi:hypothetical protein
VTERERQFATGPLRQPKRTTMVLPAVVLSEHEKELLNNESLFSQLALEFVDRTEGAACTMGATGRATNRIANDPRRRMTAPLLSDALNGLSFTASRPEEYRQEKQNSWNSYPDCLLCIVFAFSIYKCCKTAKTSSARPTCGWPPMGLSPGILRSHRRRSVSQSERRD